MQTGSLVWKKPSAVPTSGQNLPIAWNPRRPRLKANCPQLLSIYRYGPSFIPRLLTLLPTETLAVISPKHTFFKAMG